MRSSAFRLLSFLAVAVAVTVFAGAVSAQPVINEVRIDHGGTDTDEYFELKGTPSLSLAGYTYVVIGDNTANTCGNVEEAVALDAWSIQADGYFAAVDTTDGYTLTGYDALTSLNFENSDNVTHLLVTGWTGNINDDLDTDNDGVLDVTPWTAIIDCIGLDEGKVPNCTTDEYLYCATTIGPDGIYVPAHVYRCLESPFEWRIGIFDLGTTDTPGADNLTCAVVPFEIQDEIRTPCVPSVSQSVAAQVVVTSATGAKLFYTVNGGLETELAMSPVATSGDTTTYEATIPGQGTNGDLVEYYVRAYDATPDSLQGHAQGYFVGTMNIADLRVNDVNGANLYPYYGARVAGNVTIPPGRLSLTNTDYYVQDATSGINVFQFGIHPVSPGLGDDITVTGSLIQYNGKLEISSGGPCDLQVEVNGPGSPPAPLLIDSCDMGEAVEGMLVKMKIAYLPTNPDTFRANTNYDITNCIPDTVLFRVEDNVGLDDVAVTSQYIDIVGIVNQYDFSSPFDADYQLLPRYTTDITFVAATDVPDRVVGPVARLMQNYPNPFSRNTQIHYSVPSGARGGEMVPVKLQVFDISGRLVTTVVDGLEVPGDHVVSLAGEAFGNAGNGIYFYRLDVGNTVITRKLMLMR